MCRIKDAYKEWQAEEHLDGDCLFQDEFEPVSYLEDSELYEVLIDRLLDGFTNDGHKRTYNSTI